MALATFARTHRLSEVNYWFDESFCLKMAEFSIVELWSRSAADTHPPLYFLLLKLWGWIFGTSAAAARLLSGALGLSAIVGVYLFVREAYRPPGTDPVCSPSVANRAALVAAALIAMSPLHISWSLQVRMYSLGTALTAFSSWLLIRALRSSPPRRVDVDWCLYTVAAILLAYTHYFGLFTVAAQYAFAATYICFHKGASEEGRTRSFSPLIVSGLCVAFVWQFCLLSFIGQTKQVVASFWSEPLTLAHVGNSFYQMFGVHEWAESSSLYGLAIAQIAFFALLVLLLGRMPADGYVTLAALVPIGSALLISSFSRNIVVARYFQFAHVFLLVATAVLLCRIPWRFGRCAAIALTLSGAMMLTWLHYEWREGMAEHPGMQAAVRRFEELRRPGEPLLVCNPMLYTSVVAYLRSRNDVYTHGSNRHYPFFHGTAVMRDQEYLSQHELNDGSFAYAWTLGADRWMGDSWSVPMTAGWSQIGESRFSEYYCELVLRLYARQTPAEDGPSSRDPQRRHATSARVSRDGSSPPLKFGCHNEFRTDTHSGASETQALFGPGSASIAF